MADEQESALLASSGKLSTLADGTLRITFDIDPKYKQQAFRLFGDHGTPAAIARLENDAATRAGRPGHAYGMEAKALHLSGFFRSPALWKLIGSQDDYGRWVRTNPCAFASESCHGDIVAAHVRRIEYGAGVGRKPPYAEIPMCDHHHRIQHQHGESAVAPPDEFEALRIQYISRWARVMLKQCLGYESWADVPPDVLRGWAIEHGVDDYLPIEYRGVGG
jgi:hypothetical protein